MRQLDYQMSNGYITNHVGLNVRASNEVAKMLYCNKMGYSVSSVVRRYYCDDEDAFFLHKTLGDPLEDRLLQCGIERGGNERLEGIRWISSEMRSYWDKKIAGIVGWYWGKKIGHVDSSVWSNGRIEFRLPRTYPK